MAAQVLAPLLATKSRTFPSDSESNTVAPSGSPAGALLYNELSKIVIEMADYSVEQNQGALDILEAFADRDADDESRAIEKETALQALAYVLGKNFSAAEATEKDGVFSLSMKVTFDRNESPTEVKATARCSKVSSAEIALSCKQND